MYEESGKKYILKCSDEGMLLIAFLGFLNLSIVLVIRTKCNVSETGSISVFMWKGREESIQLGPTDWADLSH
jgi:hypothetical protein